MKNLMREFFKRPIAYQPIIAKAFKSVNLAILWCQLYYWSDKTRDPDGWIYKTHQDFFNETALSRRQQFTAAQLGKKLKIIETKRAREGGILHYKINIDEAIKILMAYSKKNPYKKIEKKKKEYYQGESVINKNGKKYIIINSEWFEINDYNKIILK